MSSPLDFLPNRLRANSSVLFSATAVGLSAIVVAYGVGAIGQALLAPSINAEDADPLASLGEESAEFMEKSRLRFEGRSMYSLPPRPVPKVRVVETPKLPEPRRSISVRRRRPQPTRVRRRRACLASSCSSRR